MKNVIYVPLPRHNFIQRHNKCINISMNIHEYSTCINCINAFDKKAISALLSASRGIAFWAAILSRRTEPSTCVAQIVTKLHAALMQV